MSTELATRLRAETRAWHARAEESGIMRQLLQGRITRPSYCGLLRNLYEIYAALEQALARHASHPFVAPVHFPPLARAARLSADLCALHGAAWAREIPVQPAAHVYVARIRELEDTAPELLAAHAYVRYLGDLSGGRILHQLVVEGLGLGDGEGTGFYDFAELGEPGAFRARYRTALNGIPADPPWAARLVREAKVAFALHVRLFRALAEPGHSTQAAGPFRAE